MTGYVHVSTVWMKKTGKRTCRQYVAKFVFYYPDTYVIPAFQLKSGRAREFVHCPITSTAWGITFLRTSFSVNRCHD